MQAQEDKTTFIMFLALQPKMLFLCFLCTLVPIGTLTLLAYWPASMPVRESSSGNVVLFPCVFNLKRPISKIFAWSPLPYKTCF